jgi:hypothetical protein
VTTEDLDQTPFERDGWTGYVAPWRGTPVGLFCIRVRKGSRMIALQKLDARAVETFDPERHWKEGMK